MFKHLKIKSLKNWKLFENRSEAEIVMKWKCRVYSGMPQDCGIENWKLEIENSQSP